MLPANEDFFRMIVENGEDFFAVLDLDGKRIYNSPSYAKLFGKAQELRGSDSFAEIHPEDRERVELAFLETAIQGTSHRLHFRFVLPNGEIRHMESCGTLIRDSRGQPLRVVVVSRDVTERVKNEQAIHDLAFHDELTKLPNRRLLGDRLDQAIAAGKRSGKLGALMMLDLDRFKELNDRHGHMMGDLLLIEASRRITRCLREIDTVARLGGDEFVVLLGELHHDEAEATTQARVVAEKIRAALALPYVLSMPNATDTAITHHCTTSIGITLFLNHDQAMRDMLTQADKAMYQAKAAGRNMIRFFTA